MVLGLLKKVFGTRNDREVNRIQVIVDGINQLEVSIGKLSNDQLLAKTSELKARLDEGATLDDILPEAFAVVRETGLRTLKMRHFDVQMIGGIVLHEGKIAEMKTGEGKTLAATLPVYLNSLEGKGSHVVITICLKKQGERLTIAMLLTGPIMSLDLTIFAII